MKCFMLSECCSKLLPKFWFSEVTSEVFCCFDLLKTSCQYFSCVSNSEYVKNHKPFQKSHLASVFWDLTSQDRIFCDRSSSTIKRKLDVFQIHTTVQWNRNRSFFTDLRPNVLVDFHHKMIMKCNSVHSLKIEYAFFVLILYCTVTIFAIF